ncbi:MAG TPA: DUF4433 domain-containing protein [Desulfobacterales bacterium]|nr:DUF4433 domain-containing protein [Desulfobacterales bacterium]
MSVSQNLENRHAYHFTHFQNLDSIIDNEILSTNLKISKGVEHKNIAEKGIQSRRSAMLVPCAQDKRVHDYVPFYFSKKTSMQLGVINKKNVDQAYLIYFLIPVSVIEKIDGTVFSDASANTEVPPNFHNFSQVEELENLNWEAIDSKKWSSPNDTVRHQKMAELLIPDQVMLSDIKSIVVWNKFIKGKVEEVFKSKGVKPPEIRFDSEHYYTNFYEGGRRSIITGPIFLRQAFERSVKFIRDNVPVKPRFASLEEALDKIEKDFCSIKELANIDGLKASYGPHEDDVGTHVRKVAAALSKYDEFNSRSEADQIILKFSAYFHDIGKGPKSRWPNEIMNRSDNDHAVKSLPMLERVLTEEVGGLDDETIRKIVMLVTYDDIIGDIVARGRDEEQLFQIINSENDLIMLIALGKSDMSSINEAWVSGCRDDIKSLKDRAVESLG